MIVDQHGQPRAKFLSPDAADRRAQPTAWTSPGAIYSLDIGEHRVPAGVRRAAAASASRSSPASPTSSSSPTRRRSRSCPGHRVPAGCSPTRTSATAGRCRWTRGACCAASSTASSSTVAELPQRPRGGVLHHPPLRPAHRAGRDRPSRPPSPAVEPFQLGYQYLSEVRLDSVNDTLTALRDGLAGVGLLPRAMEDEWGPGQMEFSLSPRAGLGDRRRDGPVPQRGQADLRAARAARHVHVQAASCRTSSPPAGTCTCRCSTRPARTPSRDAGRRAVADWDAATSPACSSTRAAMTAFATPTINGYTRFQPYSFAPDRISWAVENRGALVRVQGGPGDPAPTSRTGSASRRPTPTSTSPPTSPPGWTASSAQLTAAAARSRRTRTRRTPRRCRRPGRGARRAGRQHRCSASSSAPSSSTTT